MKTRKHLRLANGQPAVSCFALEYAELVRRETAAHQRAERRARQDGLGAELVGRGELWHREWPQGLKVLVCDEQLFRLAACLPAALCEANGGQPLDFFDYGYVADVLREWLREPTPWPTGDAQNLRRALAWAEERGRGLCDFSQEA